jgi:hypothetical protein
MEGFEPSWPAGPRFLRPVRMPCVPPHPQGSRRLVTQSVRLVLSGAAQIEPRVRPNRVARYIEPRAKSEISCGVAVSKPTTSSIPGSAGSAIEKPFETMPTTTSRASLPDRSR